MVASSPFDKRLVYLIDDDQEILIVLQKMLMSFGVDVEIFSTPESLIKRLKEKRPDLCFVDINYGQNLGAGFQLIQAIRKKISDQIAIIALSSRDSSDDIAQAFEIGCDDYITKPIRAKVIEAKLKQHLSYEKESSLPMSPVPDNFKPCVLSIGFYLYHISETGFTILTQHFIPKKTAIEFDRGILFEIIQKKFTLKVHYNWIQVDSGLFAASFLFPSDDRHFKNSFRKWMLMKDTE